MVQPIKGAMPPPRPPRDTSQVEPDPLAGLPAESALRGLRQLPSPPMRLCGPTGALHHPPADSRPHEPLAGLRAVPAHEVAPAIRRTAIGTGDI